LMVSSTTQQPSRFIQLVNNMAKHSDHLKNNARMCYRSTINLIVINNLLISVCVCVCVCMCVCVCVCIDLSVFADVVLRQGCFH